jgi:hypothetical protein
MAFDWRRFVELADELSLRADEAALRTAVSRAYYGLLGVAVAALPTVTRATITHGNVHIATWNLYAASSALPCRQVGHAGHRLRRVRLAVDYQSMINVPLADMRPLVEGAQRAMLLLDRHGYQP